MANCQGGGRPRSSRFGREDENLRPPHQSLKTEAKSRMRKKQNSQRKSMLALRVLHPDAVEGREMFWKRVDTIWAALQVDVDLVDYDGVDDEDLVDDEE